MVKSKARIGELAPLFSVSDWIQGEPTNFDQLNGRVVFVEVFQVNCPGCFLYALPQAIEIYQQYFDRGLSVIGIATAFEDFDKNTLENLKLLVEKNEVVGETHLSLSQRNMLVDGRYLPYKIPFPLAMDFLVKNEGGIIEAEIAGFINEHVPDFFGQAKANQERILQQVHRYFEKLEYRPRTFDTFNLKGTPSYLLVDKKGILRSCSFGEHSDLEAQIIRLLQE